MTEQERTVFWEEVRRATRLVESWPKWKQNILGHSGKPTVDVARKPIVTANEKQESQ